MATDQLLSYRLDQTKKSIPQKEVIPANYESNDVDIELDNFLKTSTIKVNRFYLLSEHDKEACNAII